MPPRGLLVALLTAALVACGPVAIAQTEDGTAPPTVTRTEEEVTMVGDPVPVRLVRHVYHESYAVEGTTPASIRASMDSRKPPAFAKDPGHDGVTLWDLKWSFHFDDRPGGCTLAGATVELTVVVLTPELDTSALLPETRERWLTYLDALEAHEATHVGIETDGANALQALYAEPRSRATCSELGQELHDRGMGEIGAIVANDRDFDARSAHGGADGAVFP
jgi:predicted secreted Zn-dependent protease